MEYKAPEWLIGGHAQTIWSAICARKRWAKPLPMLRHRWTAPDGDFIDVDTQLASHAHRPLLILFHGLEGSSQSHYAQAFAEWAAEQDLNFAIPHFRGCSGELNHAPRAYHSGDHQEIDWILDRFRHQHQQQGGRIMVATGVSLGGNALMRWASEHGEQAKMKVDAVASICSPLDLRASGIAIGKGFNRLIYTRMFLRSMKPKALVKLNQHPGLFDRKRLMAAKDLYDFDNVFTAPLHGFKNTEDYWQRASAKPLMREIAIPALALNALNDPFIPAQSLPSAKDVSPSVTLWHLPEGGHVGFTQGGLPGNLRYLPTAVGTWLLQSSGHTQNKDDFKHG